MTGLPAREFQAALCRLEVPAPNENFPGQRSGVLQIEMPRLVAMTLAFVPSCEL